MRRRQVLSAVAAVALSFAGCTDAAEPDDRTTVDGSAPTDTTADTPTDTQSPTPTDTPVVTRNPDDPVLFVVGNDTDDRQTVSVRLSRDGTVLLDETATLEPDASTTYDPGISETGRYELVVDVEDGPRRTLSLHMDGYTVRTGANHYVSVLPDRIGVYWEE